VQFLASHNVFIRTHSANHQFGFTWSDASRKRPPVWVRTSCGLWLKELDLAGGQKRLDIAAKEAFFHSQKL
jgi:hypothetical protein